uniref:Uncharacterized protein n=1 Tax=viral metagenome TaxID=1070528 RepID=A0A6M3LRY7_9ZZZZ
MSTIPRPRCHRCGGYVYFEEDAYLKYFKCVNCGCERLAEKDREWIRTLQAMQGKLNPGGRHGK